MRTRFIFASCECTCTVSPAPDRYKPNSKRPLPNALWWIQILNSCRYEWMKQNKERKEKNTTTNGNTGNKRGKNKETWVSCRREVQNSFRAFYYFYNIVHTHAPDFFFVSCEYSSHVFNVYCAWFCYWFWFWLTSAFPRTKNFVSGFFSVWQRSCTLYSLLHVSRNKFIQLLYLCLLLLPVSLVLEPHTVQITVREKDPNKSFKATLFTIHSSVVNGWCWKRRRRKN